MRKSLNTRMALVYIATVTLLMSGCNKGNQKLQPDKMSAMTSETVLGKPNAELKKSIKVELLSKPVPGLLGGEGEAQPIAGAKLIAKVGKKSHIKVTPAEGITDLGGCVEFDVCLGNSFADEFVEVAMADDPSIKKKIRFVTGVSLENGKQEVKAGEAIKEPIRVKLASAEGVAITNETVYFTLVRQPGKKGKLSKSEVKTDMEGVAVVSLKTDPKATGKYEVRMEVANPESGLVVRPIFAEVMAMNVMTIVIGVFGGLAIFIFGMTLMSDGLQQVAGNKMKAVLNYITRNRMKAILAGTLVTAVIQSSSATTVMTIGFVNAGLLSLQQAIGVVFGANIGTTVTGQMVSFKLDNLALPAVILGVIGILIFRKVIWQGTARTILGFGLLFFGMTMMSSELKAVSSFPSFVAFFQIFDCAPLHGGSAMPLGHVLGAIAIGTLTTMVVQSSSATIGLAIALANSGLINFWTAVPIILGDNIGTTITAILASLNANRIAKQAALAHSMFNILGTLYMVILFYVPFRGVPCFLWLVTETTSGNVWIGENIGRHVAMAHTLFNVTNVVLLTPFIGVLVWLCERIVPKKKEDVAITRLEPHLLNTPSLALDCALSVMGDMVEKDAEILATTMASTVHRQAIDVDRVKKVEDEVDKLQGDVMGYLVQLTARKLTEEQSASVPLLIHCVNDAERISDSIYRIARDIQKKSEVWKSLSEEARADLTLLGTKMQEVSRLTLEGIRHSKKVEGMDVAEQIVKQVRLMSHASIERHVLRLMKGDCTPERGIFFVELMGRLQSIARHYGNIAERVGHIQEATE